MCSSVAVMDQTLISECRMMLCASREFNTRSNSEFSRRRMPFLDDGGQRRVATASQLLLLDHESTS